jgi:hypothetical protein
MDLVDKAFFRWQMLNQPRRFRQSLAAVRDELVCALSLHERMPEHVAAVAPTEPQRKDERSR